jgi:eukaryotic-like serine/threonine-protein kinase
VNPLREMGASVSRGGTERPGATPSLRAAVQAALGDSYAVERELAAGARAHLFLATDPALGRRVVLKVLLPELSATLDVARFRREIRLAARLAHPNIVPVLSAGERGGFLYYTMPFVEGESLHARLARDGELPVAEVVSILRDLAKALAYAHARGVVHRDLKPDNVLLEHGTALLTDFGIAKALDAAVAPARAERTAEGIAVGTPTYVSPEQAAGDPRVDHRTDLYSLGVVAFEMLAGQPPFTHRALRALLAAHQTEPPPSIATRREGVPSWLQQLVRRLLEKRAADRPQSADEVVQVLDAAATTPQGATPQPARGRRLPLVESAAIAMVLLMVAVGGDAWKQHSPRASARATAAAEAPARPANQDAVAVLSFATVGRDSVEQLFADGLVDELTSALGALPDVRIASRTSVATLQANHLTAVAIADSLHVGRVLEGTVERVGDRLRVTAQLTSARDGLALWSATYERPARDPFAVQDEVTRDLVRTFTRHDSAGPRQP